VKRLVFGFGSCLFLVLNFGVLTSRQSRFKAACGCVAKDSLKDALQTGQAIVWLEHVRIGSQQHSTRA
jgi:hypothetical protein